VEMGRQFKDTNYKKENIVITSRTLFALPEERIEAKRISHFLITIFLSLFWTTFYAISWQLVS